MASVYTVGAPVGGLNARDSVADMPETDALTMVNWFCEPDYVRVRRGYQSFATGVGASPTGCVSLFAWEGPTSGKMFAASTTAIYDITSGGAAGTPDVSSLTNGEWQGAMMATSGGNFLVIANGADSVRHYNGATWTAPTISGVTSSTLRSPAVHKRRLWFVEVDSTKAWYLGTDSIAGTATSFDFGPLFSEGGKLLAIGSMTRDGGAGPDDYACFVSDNGEIAVYAGTDPASASTWALVGVYRVSAPIGQRCLERVGGDLMLITEGGVVLFSAMMALDRSASDRASVTSKVNRRFNSDALLYGARSGWSVVRKPRANMLLINIPGQTQVVSEIFVDDDNEALVTDSGAELGFDFSEDQFTQYAMNTLSGAWSFFTGWDAQCWVLFADELYFGNANGSVFLADAGYRDNGQAITCDIKTAFSSHGAKGRQKAYAMCKPYLEVSGVPGILMEMNVNYEDREPSIVPTATSSGQSLWGVAEWGIDDWSTAASFNVRDDWQGVVGIGTVGALRLRVTTRGSEVKLLGFDVMHEKAGWL